MEVQLPDGTAVPLRALYDSGAEINLVSLQVVQLHKMEHSLFHSRPRAGSLDDQELRLQKPYDITVKCSDNEGTPKTVGPQRFWSADFKGYDMVLGYPWLRDADPQIHFSKGTFRWWPEGDADRIQITNASDLLHNIAKGERAYVLHPGGLSCSTISEQFRKLLEDAEEQRSPDPPTPQPGPSGDEIRDDDWYNHRGILWVKAWVDRTKAHLDKCIADAPDLVGLPEEATHRLVAAVFNGDPQRAAVPPHKGRSLPDGEESPPEFHLADDEPDPEELKHVPSKLHHRWLAFSKRQTRTIRPNSEYDHAIEIEEGKKIPNLPIYNLSGRELEILREYLAAAQEKGWIRPSKSPVGAPILFVPKSDGIMRFCVDYRGLNKVTIKDRYPIPLVSEMLDRLSKAAIYTKLDLRDAYHRLRIREGDEWKTAFKTRYGHYEYNVMPFGLANAPATFQSYVHRALGGLIDRTCVVYLDDILIYSGDEAEHDRHVEEVLDRLVQWGLFCKASKCAFSTKSVEFLGFIVTPGGVVMDPVRVQTIQEWPEPTGYKDIQVFLGFCNFYRRFIYNYSAIVRPLVDLMTRAQAPPTLRTHPEPGEGQKKKVKSRKGPTKWYLPWLWPEDAQEAFNTLRQKFTEAPVLQHFDPTKPVIVLTDASDFAMAAILLQPSDTDVPTEKHWKPVAFWSKKFTGPSLRWHTHDKELSAIVESFKTWRHYLEYAPSTIRVLSDHNNLRYFMTTKELSPKQARWAEELARFDFEIEYKPGANNPADGPSRRPDYAQGLRVGEQKALQDAMLPTLQQKLRIWTIRMAMASSTTPEVRGSEPLDEGPERSRQPSETLAPEQEFPDTMSEPGDASPTLPRT